MQMRLSVVGPAFFAALFLLSCQDESAHRGSLVDTSNPTPIPIPSPSASPNPPGSVPPGTVISGYDTNGNPISMTVHVTTGLGIRVQAPSWIDPLDYAQLGYIIDKYYIDFHGFMGVVAPPVGNLKVVIHERLRSFASNASSTGCAAGMFTAGIDTIVVSWLRRGDGSASNPWRPGTDDVLSAFPHELTHRWRYLVGDPNWGDHNYSQLQLDADAYASQQSPLFTGDLSHFNPANYDPNSCAWPPAGGTQPTLMVAPAATAAGTAPNWEVISP